MTIEKNIKLINFHTPKLLFHIEEIFSVMQNIEKKY